MSNLGIIRDIAIIVFCIYGVVGTIYAYDRLTEKGYGSDSLIIDATVGFDRYNNIKIEHKNSCVNGDKFRNY